MATIVTALDISETLAHNQGMNYLLLGFIALLVLAMTAAIVMWLRWQFRPLTQITGKITGLSRGEEIAEDDLATRNDEIGSLAKALAVFREALAKQMGIMREQVEQAEREQRNIQRAGATAKVAAMERGIGNSDARNRPSPCRSRSAASSTGWKQVT